MGEGNSQIALKNIHWLVSRIPRLFYLTTKYYFLVWCLNHKNIPYWQSWSILCMQNLFGNITDLFNLIIFNLYTVLNINALYLVLRGFKIIIYSKLSKWKMECFLQLTTHLSVQATFILSGLPSVPIILSIFFIIFGFSIDRCYCILYYFSSCCEHLFSWEWDMNSKDKIKWGTEE